jgi:hypothetical protein
LAKGGALPRGRARAGTIAARSKDPTNGDPWGWLLPRLAPDHPEHVKACWWARQLVFDHPPPTDPQTNRAVVDALFAVALGDGEPTRCRIEAARALMEMSLTPLRAARVARRLLDRGGFAASRGQSGEPPAG